jgi:hydrogenase nickel incorporation protein HypA/HybF
MHEAFLMKNLLAAVEKAAHEEAGGPVRVVHLRIGDMAGVSTDALRFAFDVMARGTAADGASLEIEAIPLIVRCKACGAEWQPGDFVFVCSACGSFELDVLSGREMEVDYILVGDEERGSAGAGA